MKDRQCFTLWRCYLGHTFCCHTNDLMFDVDCLILKLCIKSHLFDSCVIWICMFIANVCINLNVFCFRWTCHWDVLKVRVGIPHSSLQNTGATICISVCTVSVCQPNCYCILPSLFSNFFCLCPLFVYQNVVRSSSRWLQEQQYRPWRLRSLKLQPLTPVPRYRAFMSET